MSGSPASVPDDTEVVPPKSQKQIHRRQQASMPFPANDEEPFLVSSAFVASELLTSDVLRGTAGASKLARHVRHRVGVGGRGFDAYDLSEELVSHSLASFYS